MFQDTIHFIKGFLIFRLRLAVGHNATACGTVQVTVAGRQGANSDAGIHGAIIGKAIYEHRINLKDAVNMFESGASVIEAGKKMSTSLSFKDFKLNSDGLIPVVVQDYVNNEVLMVAYMNEESYNMTVDTGIMTYFSRSRQELWIKGATSGHYQYVSSLDIDCDNDTILAKVRQIGAACHTGNRSCFYRNLYHKDR